VNISSDDTEFDPFAHNLKKRKPKGSGTPVAWLALVLAAAAAGLSGYQWWIERLAGAEADGSAQEVQALRQSHSGLQQSLEALRAEFQSADQRYDPAKLAAIGSDLKEIQARLDELELKEAGDEALLDAVQSATASLYERLNSQDTTLAALARRGDSPGKSMDLAEVDYLLRLAAERLDLFGDVRSADHALELAQSHLDALDDPLYLSVRRKVEQARLSLADVPVLDMVAVSGRISVLQSAIPSMPFPGEITQKSGPAVTGNEGIWQRIKNTLTPLVKVRRRVDDSTLLSLEDKDYLRQGLWLQLETARLALMRNDSHTWQLSLARTSDTLQTRFDRNSPAVREALGQLEELSALPLVSTLPDISGAWTQLRLLREGLAPPGGHKPADEEVIDESAAETPALPGPAEDETPEVGQGMESTAEGGGVGA